jgi:hypothetical protein
VLTKVQLAPLSWRSVRPNMREEHNQPVLQARHQDAAPPGGGWVHPTKLQTAAVLVLVAVLGNNVQQAKASPGKRLLPWWGPFHNICHSIMGSVMGSVYHVVRSCGCFVTLHQQAVVRPWCLTVIGSSQAEPEQTIMSCW